MLVPYRESKRSPSQCVHAQSSPMQEAAPSLPSSKYAADLEHPPAPGAVQGDGAAPRDDSVQRDTTMPMLVPVGAGQSTVGAEENAARRTDCLLDYLQSCWALVDVDGSGVLSMEEFMTVWGKAVPGQSQTQVEQAAIEIFNEIDQDYSGAISFNELSQYLRGELDSGDVADIMRDAQATKVAKGVRDATWAVFEQPYGADFRNNAIRRTSAAVGAIVQIAIMTSIITMTVESTPRYQNRDQTSGTPTTIAIETSCILLFSIEFVGRTLSTPSQLSYWTDGFTWVDLLAVLPFYLTLVGAIEEGGSSQGLVALRVVRLVRLVRVLRVLKLGRRSQGIQLMMIALKRSYLALVWLCFLVLMALLLFASLMFHAERDEAEFDHDGTMCDFCQDKWVRKKDSKYDDRGTALNAAFQSIPDGMWWGIVTLTTVGYGDAFPRTELGKAVAGLCMMSAIIVLAYPVTILTSSFSEAWEEHKSMRQRKQRKKIVQEGITLLHRAAEELPQRTFSSPTSCEESPRQGPQARTTPRTPGLSPRLPPNASADEAGFAAGLLSRSGSMASAGSSRRGTVDRAAQRLRKASLPDMRRNVTPPDASRRNPRVPASFAAKTGDWAGPSAMALLQRISDEVAELSRTCRAQQQELNSQGLLLQSVAEQVLQRPAGIATFAADFPAEHVEEMS
eukprot:TRINITY_DN5860_c0_g1_i1.p1 TRINITY_DN5860_c0_g1~~TRINITY_DN5860_c0_g1_i1.p1  ORF type:complete len:704 (+),score=152.21 TRINITY_DN5860_c0_g1_i1:82-2112(+)